MKSLRVLPGILVLATGLVPLLLPSIAFAQDAASITTMTKGDATLLKFNRIDVLGKIIPLVMTKEQIRGLLTAIEKARQTEVKTRVLDAQEFLKLDEEVTKAIEDGTTKNAYPSIELQSKIVKVTSAVAIRRQIATAEMIEFVYDAVVKTLDAGQRKVMANSLKPETYDPRLKPATMTDEDKQRFFIRTILLDGITYDLLVKMSK